MKMLLALGLAVAGMFSSQALALDAAVSQAPGAPAHVTGGPSGLGDAPVDISADEARVNEANHTVLLLGHVVAKQGEVQLQANTVTVHYIADKKSADNSSGTIERLEAQGDVVVTRPGEIVKSAAATYKMIEKQILMTGNVIATRAGSIVRGDSLIVDLVKETIKLEAGEQSGRVRAIFTPPKNGAKP